MSVAARAAVVDPPVVAGASGDLIVQRPEGLYCPAGDFHIDPWRAVPRAVITHAHADHARRGHGSYLSTSAGAVVLKARLGAIPLQTLEHGESLDCGGVRVSLHPAGHVLGSAQVRLEHRGQVWVASGDYFVSGAGCHNPTCVPFEPVRCHTFVTESTFGLPLYQWPRQADEMARINAWWRAHADEGRVCVLLAYSLGKAQRLLAGLDPGIGLLAAHAAVRAINAAYAASGVELPPTVPPEALATHPQRQRALVVTPPMGRGGAADDWLAPLGRPALAFASGWMQLRRARQRQGAGFVLSDHADWPGLQRAIAATGASRVIVTHGQQAPLVRWLQQQGLQAEVFSTAYGDEAAN